MNYGHVSIDNYSLSESSLQSMERLYEKDKIKQLQDDRSAIQKKTFTKWINTYLIKVGQSVDDLYLDLSDGNRLITLLEILTGDRLPRERGKMRFHKLQNVENALELLKRRKVRLVNIRNDDIVDGNPKLILGLIWTIILNFEISHDPENQVGAKATLVDWAKRATKGYKGVDVKNLTSSFRNGMAFNAIIHRFRPDIIDYENLVPENAEENLEKAFSVAEEALGIPRLLDVEDFILDELDEKSIMTYLSAFNRMYSKVPTEEELAVKVYSDRVNVDAKRILSWIKNNIDRLEKKIYKMDPEMFAKYKTDLDNLEKEEMPEKRELKEYLGDCFKNLKLAEAEDMITTDITMEKIEKFWEILEKSLADKRAAVQAEDDRISAQDELAERIQQKAEQAAQKLDQIKQLITDPPPGTDLGVLIEEAKQLLYNSNMEEDTRAMYSGVSALVKENHSRADELAKEVQLISDELDEIKLKIDTLHEDLEQGAIDAIDTDINDLLSKIHGLNDRIKAAGYGEDLPSSLRVLDELLKLMDSVDDLQYDITAVNKAAAENPKVDLKMEAKLSEVEYAYSQLKNACVTKDQDMREGVEFLETIQELLSWGREAEKRELGFDWSEYHPKDHAYEKSLVQGISKNQKKFDQVLTLGKQLIKTEHPMSCIIGEEVQELCGLWTSLKDLGCVAERHIQHHNDYHLFWKRLNNANMWIKQKRSLLDTRYNAKCLDVVSSSERLQELVDMRKDIIGYDPTILEIANLGKVVINLSKRKKPDAGEKILALCSYKRKSGNKDHSEIISRDEECQYVSSVSLDEWRVKKGLPVPARVNGGSQNGHQHNGTAGLVTEAPSSIFTTLPPDLECLTQSQKTRTEYNDLKVTYDKQRAFLKHILVKHEFFSNCDVVLTWPYDKNFEAELTGRELVISNLKEAGASLLEEAAKHSSSEQEEIHPRQTAALSHWQALLDRHRHKTASLERLHRAIADLEADVCDLQDGCEEVDVNSDNVTCCERGLDKMLKDILEMDQYSGRLEEEICEESDVSCEDDFKPLLTKLDKIRSNLAAVQHTCEDKASCVGKLINLRALLTGVGVELGHVSDTLSLMQLYPLDLEIVEQDIKKLQMISEALVGEEEHISAIEVTKEEISDILHGSPMLQEITVVLDKRDVIENEINNRSSVLSGQSEPAIAHFETSVVRALHWLEDAEEKLKREHSRPSFKERYQLLAALKSDVVLRSCLFDDLKSAQGAVIESSDHYEQLLASYRTQYPVTRPGKPSERKSARSLAHREGNTVLEQYQRIKEDVHRLLLVNEEKYKTFERLAEELGLVLKWCRDAKDGLDNPPQVLIQLKEVSRLKAQQQGMVDDVISKGKELSDLRDQITDYVTQSEDKTLETEQIAEKLKLVEEEYTIILSAAKAASQDLQETMDRVEKVVYWYNCLQQYLRHSRKRLEILDPVATDVVEVAKQLKHCKAITTELESKEELIEEMMKESEYLLSLADNDHLYVIPADLGDKVTGFRSDWKKFCTKCRSQEKRLERTYGKLRKLEAALEKILRWQTEKEKDLAAAPPISNEPSVIKEQLDQIKSLRAIVDGCESHITTANELARSLINKAKPGPGQTIPPLKVKLEKINAGWKRMDSAITERLYDLEAALKRSQTIEKAMEDIRRWLEEKEALLKDKEPLTIKHDQLQDILSKYTELKRDIHGYEGVLASTTSKALEGLSLDDIDKMKTKLGKLQDRYSAIRAECDQHQDKLQEVYKGMDVIRREVVAVNGMLDRAKEQSDEMTGLGTSLPVLNSQLKDVTMLIDSIDAIRPEIASLTTQCDNACELALVQDAPKIQREILKLPKLPEESVATLDKTSQVRKQDIEDQIQKLKRVEDNLDRFMDELARNKKDFDRQSSAPNLHSHEKKELIGDYQKCVDGLERNLKELNSEVDEILTGVEDTPFLKRRLQEAKQKLDEFSITLNSGKEEADKVDNVLNKSEKERLCLMDDILLLEEDIEGLEPISVNVAAATAQSLQTMTMAEKCEGLRRKLEDLKYDVEDISNLIPEDTLLKIEEEQEKISAKLNKSSDRLKNRSDALDGVLPFITSLQETETELLPWLDDISKDILNQSARSPSTPQEVQDKIGEVKDLMTKVEHHQIDVEDVATAGESALELVTSYDKDNMCQSALDLSTHLEEVQQRYSDLKLNLDELECDLNNKEQITSKLADIVKVFDKVQQFADNMPVPRLQEAELVQYMCDIDDELGDVHAIEEQVRDLESQFPSCGEDPQVRAFLDKMKETKTVLEDKKDDLQDKCDMLDALSADIQDIHNAIKSINPQRNACPLTDLKSVEENEKYQEAFSPKIASLEDKLEKLEEVHIRISKDCNPVDVKKLELKITDLKQKCKEKEEKKKEKLEELQRTKEQLGKFDEVADQLSTWLENQINQLKNQEPPSADTEALKNQLNQHNKFTDDIQDEGKEYFKDLLTLAQTLKNDLLQNDKVPLNDKVADLQKKYDTLLKDTTQRQEDLENSMLAAKNTRDTMEYILPWLEQAESDLLGAEKPGAEAGVVTAQVDKHKADTQQLQSHAHLVDSLRGQEGLGEEDKELLDEILAKWDKCQELSEDRAETLNTALDQVLDLEKTLADINNFIDSVETQLLEMDAAPLNSMSVVEDMVATHQKLKALMVTRESDVDLANALADGYKSITEPDQAEVLQGKVEEMNRRWQWLQGEALEREAALQRAREATAAVDGRINDLLHWLQEQEHAIKSFGPVADTYDNLVTQLDDQKKFHAGFDDHQEDYDSIVMTCQELLVASEDPSIGESLDEKLQDLGNKWDSVVKASMARQRAIEEALQICHDFQDSVNAILEWLPDAEQALDNLEPISDDYETISEQIQELLQLSYFMAEQNTAVEQVCTLGAIREETGPALSEGEAASYREMKERYKELWNKIGARQDELNRKQDDMEDGDDLANFDITEWKKRFLRWMDGNHERIIDLFRKFDVNKDGTLSHQEFKDGIIQAGIPTPRSCFPVIIREFDRDDSGDINYREFAAALKRYEFKPKTEGEHIDYEVQRAVDRCSCRRRFNCVQVGEAKYSPGNEANSRRFNGVLWRFGNMQKLYLVRILSTVVMVRVGGGWQPLHEFLQKYDPCRAKGRTNVDLGKVSLKKAGDGKVVSPLKFLSKFNKSAPTPRGAASTPRSGPPEGRARRASGEASGGRAGIRPSASRDFEGLDVEHDGKQVSFPGYKVKGGYVSPYSCQALGLKKRSGSQGSLCSSGSTEFDSPVRRSPSKTGVNKSGSRNSVLSRSSSKGSVSTRGTFGTTSRGLSTPRKAPEETASRSASRSDLSGSPSPVTRRGSPRTPLPPRTPTPNKPSRTQSELRLRTPAAASTPVRQRSGALARTDTGLRRPPGAVARRATTSNLNTPTRPPTTTPKTRSTTKPTTSPDDNVNTTS